MEPNVLALSQLQRELGFVAARSEEGRRHAEEQLAGERRQSASLEAELEAERHRSAEAAAAAASSLGRASVSVADEQRLRSIEQQLGAEQRRSSALAAALQAEHRRSAALSEALQAERQQAALIVEQNRCLEQEAAHLREQITGRVNRELNGMSTLVRTLKRKVEIYETKLLDQAQSCAEEINDLKIQLDGSVASSCDETVANEGNEDECESGNTVFSLGVGAQSGNHAPSIGPDMGSWQPPRVASLLPAIWEPRGPLDDAEESAYVRLDDANAANIAGRSDRTDNWSPQKPQQRYQYRHGVGPPPIFTNCPESAQEANQVGYVPPVLPVLPDAI